MTSPPQERTNAEQRLTMTTLPPFVVLRALLILSLVDIVISLTPFSRCHVRTSNSRLFSSKKDEEEDELERKMALVRSLQSAYYQSDTFTATAPSLDTGTGILRNLPLWRVPWTELPGRSNVLNVHEGHYTHMYETVLRGPKPWYVGHLTLPGGSRNIHSDQRCFQLKTWQEEVNDEDLFSIDDCKQQQQRSAVVGTLLRISDFRRLSDGRLILLVQALERFVVVNCVQELPYSIADVQILPDFDDSYLITKEPEARTLRATAVLETFRYHDYEYNVDFTLPLANGNYLSAMDIWGPDMAKVLPFVPYSTTTRTTLEPSLSKLNPVVVESSNEEQDVEQPAVPSSNNEESLESRLVAGGILRPAPPFFLGSKKTKGSSMEDLEDLLWTALVDFSSASKIVLPNEILCLLPPTRDWPTHVERLSPEYPAHRRQRRLSFGASAFLEHTPVGTNLRQVWLETPGTRERLSAVLERFEAMNNQLLGEFQ